MAPDSTTVSAGIVRVDAPGAGAMPAQSVNTARGEHGNPESTRPAQASARTSNVECRTGAISFTCAYWDYLRLTPDEPSAAAFGLAESSAEVLRRQCNIEFNAQVVGRAKAAAARRKETAT